MKISLLHPSSGRPLKAIKTANFWFKKAKDPNRIEHILSCDYSDKQLQLYRSYSANNLIVNDNNCVVQATNHAAKICQGDILLYLSDDFQCPDNWDELIIEKVKNHSDNWLLKVDDCLQKFDVPVLTIPIMSRGLYNKLGYFWHPEYRSMFVDCDLFETCKKNGFIIDAKELKFPHLHPANGKTTTDQTYKDSTANWDQGLKMFKKRKSQNFPL
jgi:glycosyltransferase involved in cell wall biosynthesis